MVAKLALPASDSAAKIKDIIRARVKHKDFFISLQDKWLLQISAYSEQNGNPESITPLNLSEHISEERIRTEMLATKAEAEAEAEAIRTITKSRCNSLKNLYSQPQDDDLVKTLENMRNKHQLLFCPACGEPGKPTTLDHYLPQSKYPELSIVFENLTPMCDKCQRLKDNHTLNGLQQKIFIHPYYDPIDTVPIDLMILPPYSHPSGFIANVPNNGDENLMELVRRHIDGIGFSNRFEEYCRSEYSDLLAIIAQDRHIPNSEPLSVTIRRFIRRAEIKSINYWEAIFYRGVLGNAELLHFLEHEHAAIDPNDHENNTLS